MRCSIGGLELLVLRNRVNVSRCPSTITVGLCTPVWGAGARGRHTLFGVSVCDNRIVSQSCNVHGCGVD
eukprot:1459142-Lingulodinium_polyedra.AAC.1